VIPQSGVQTRVANTNLILSRRLTFAENRGTKESYHIHGMKTQQVHRRTPVKIIPHTAAKINGDTLFESVPLRSYTRHMHSESSIPNPTGCKSDFKIAIPIALGFAVLFFVFQKVGLIDLIDASKMTYLTAFGIGAIASFSTCMAMVGGIVLSMSATFARDGDRIKPQLMFHAGRIIAFFVLGGVIGVIGSAFTLSSFTTFILSLMVGIVMLILGINLLDTFAWADRFLPSMPDFLASRARGISGLNHTLTPALVGIATFFLPCGFTQSMQLFTLTTGDFMTGGLTMFAFALGTFPVLALVSFSSLSIKDSPRAGIFFKSAGLIVIMFALLNIYSSLVVIGVIPPLFNL